MFWLGLALEQDRVVNFALFRSYRPVTYTRPGLGLGLRLVFWLGLTLEQAGW